MGNKPFLSLSCSWYSIFSVFVALLAFIYKHLQSVAPFLALIRFDQWEGLGEKAWRVSRNEYQSLHYANPSHWNVCVIRYFHWKLPSTTRAMTTKVAWAVHPGADSHNCKPLSYKTKCETPDFFADKKTVVFFRIRMAWSKVWDIILYIDQKVKCNYNGQ